MSYGNADPVLRRNILLIGAGLCLVLSIFTGFPVLAYVTSGTGLFALAILLLGGFGIALNMLEMSADLLGGATSPWYARRGGMPLLVVVIFVMSAAIPVVLHEMFESLQPKEPTPPLSVFFLSMALQLFWIPIVDWPETRPAPPSYTPPPYTPYVPPTRKRRSPAKAKEKSTGSGRLRRNKNNGITKTKDSKPLSITRRKS